MDSLEKQIANYLKQGQSLTVVKALELFRTIELRKIVSTLRRQGMQIEDEWITSEAGKRYKRYFLNKPKSSLVTHRMVMIDMNKKKVIAGDGTQGQLIFEENPTFQENTSRISKDGKTVTDSLK